MIAASYFFYAAWDWRFLSLILCSTVADYFFAQAIYRCSQQKKKRLWLLASLFVNLGLLGFFKYFNFFADSFVDLANLLGFSVSPIMLGIILPVGISFYTFQTLSYTIDVYRGGLKPTRRFEDFALFVAFFPQLVAGPIVRAKDYLPQLEEKKLWQRVDLRWVALLFLVGFFKKAGVADNLSPYVDAYFSAPEAYGFLDSWLAVSLYSVQIYCDFSGYSDMAIAVAGLFGYRLRDNFNSPYLAIDITDFWRRWHMSLSSWLRDYLYISLGGNRHGRLFTYRNLFLTMLLGGLWHGASWNFILWGAIHGLALMMHKAWGEFYRGPRPSTFLAIGLSRFLTLFVVAMAWVPFRSALLDSTLVIWKTLLGFSAAGTAVLVDGGSLGLWIGLAGLLGLHVASQRNIWVVYWRYCSSRCFAICYGFAVALVLSLQSMDYQPFIYFQF